MVSASASSTQQTAQHPPLGTRDPILLQLDSTAQSLRFSLGAGRGHSMPLDRAHPPDPPLLKPDTWSNSEHVHFALRGCLAAVICYFVMNAVAWPGLGPSLFTCVVTALTSIGSSRQKQLLRVSGAFVGGVVFGMGAQVFILPMLDGIGGFLVMFMAVTATAAWFITASPRLSYFGAQMALGFFLIHLRGPDPQTNLAIARDNIVGILLGLTVMWLVFDTLGNKPAVQVMRELFASNLQLMARLAQPWHGGRKADLASLRATREKISQNFGAVNAQADAVLFELGRERQASLRLRNTLLSWQPRLRTLFLLEVALLQYRVPIQPEHLPADILQAQFAFDSAFSDLLDAFAQQFARTPVRHIDANALGHRYNALSDAIDAAYGKQRTPRSQGILALCSNVVRLSAALGTELNSDNPVSHWGKG